MTLFNIINQNYISSCSVTDQYKSNKRKFVDQLKKMFGKDSVIVDTCPHFEFTGFITKNGKFVYFATGDLRGSFTNTCLVRTAKNEEDFFGGRNHFVEYNSDFDENFKNKVESLLQ